jgi:hypothetical protein
MRVIYEVTACTDLNISAPAKLANGLEVSVAAPGLAVELTAEDGSTLTWRFIPKHLEEDRATYAVGEKVAVSFTSPQADGPAHRPTAPHKPE